MKKIICSILVLTILLSSLSVFSACIFNDGSADEVPGIYGLTDYHYKNVKNEYTYFGDKFEYYIIVLTEDYKCDVYYKPIDGEEVTYSTSYSLVYDTTEDGDKQKVNDIKINAFRHCHYSGITEVSREWLTSDESLSFYPMQERFTYKYSVLTKYEGNLRTKKTYYNFKKLSDRTTEKALERAKTKQINSISERTGATDSDTEE